MAISQSGRALIVEGDPPTALSRRRAAWTRWRMNIFLLAVIAINYTWARPSPVDVLFFGALLMTVFCNQLINTRTFFFICLILVWLSSVYISSMSLTADPRVVFEMFALTSVAFIGITSCLVATAWTERELRIFVDVYILSNVIAAVIGILGFVAHNPDLTWADRPRAFLDDPDMFGVFLVPGILGSLFMIAEKRRRILFSAALLLLSVPVFLSFSRAAIVSAALWGGIYLGILNRHQLLRATLSSLAFLVPLVVVVLLFAVLNDTVSHMLSGRFTVAEEYDLGHFGRYNRYLLAIPMILDHPFGLGLLQIENYFPEPIHNVWIACFLYFGWIGGLAWTLLLILSGMQAWNTWKQSRNGLCLMIFFGWLSIISCSMLHEGERWRFMWLLTGVLWGLNPRNFAAIPGPAHESRRVVATTKRSGDARPVVS
ncbi:MAG TPA: O-antigen ligase family protein [Methylovirgula sp.]